MSRRRVPRYASAERLRASGPWPFRPRGRTCGSAGATIAISRPRAAMRRDASNIAITYAGVKRVMRRSTVASPRSPAPCRRSAAGHGRTSPVRRCHARQNESFGLTTLRDRQVRVRGSKLKFRFRGKSGVEHEIELSDPRLAAIVRRMQDLPGEELFQYVDEQGETRAIESADVNAYLREIAGNAFTSKDFRTWAGTVLAAEALRRIGTFRRRCVRKSGPRSAARFIRFAGNLVEWKGIEPSTFALRTRRSPS